MDLGGRARQDRDPLVRTDVAAKHPTLASAPQPPDIVRLLTVARFRGYVLNMKTSPALLLLAGLSLSSACGNDRATPRDVTDVADVEADGEAPDVPPPDDTSDTANPPDTVAAAPNISEALSCGASSPSGPGNQGELQRYEVDTALFPDAICNNGDPAVFFFRPAADGNRDKWLINLNGGGSCSGAASCAARWCWCRSTQGPEGCPFAETTTNFSMGNMDGDERARIAGTGIFRRGDPQRPNPLGDYNQVRIVYCSSDTWTGTRRAVPFTTRDPKTGVEVSYSIHFLGSRILDAVLAILRHEAGAAPIYRLDGANEALPDLDDAGEVVLSGDSAGGAGVIGNLDRVADLLRANNSACRGGSCPLRVSGLIDAYVGPEIEPLDLTQSFLADHGGSTWSHYLTFLEAGRGTNHGTLRETSCEAYHRGRTPGPEACLDDTHLLRHHLTTPFFVRMALLDQLISSNYEEAGYRDPELGAMTPAVFAQVLRRELAAFGDLPDGAEEGNAMTRAPGVFAPACTKHDTLHDDGEVFRTGITPAGDTELTLFDVFERWRNGTTPSIVTTSRLDRSDTRCAP